MVCGVLVVSIFRGVAWLLLVLSGRGVVGGSRRRLGVVPVLLWGRCDELRGWSWVLALSSFRGAVTGFCGSSRAALVGVLAGAGAGRGSGAGALLVGCGGVPGLLKGTKKPGLMLRLCV